MHVLLAKWPERARQLDTCNESWHALGLERAQCGWGRQGRTWSVGGGAEEAPPSLPRSPPSCYLGPQPSGAGPGSGRGCWPGQLQRQMTKGKQPRGSAGRGASRAAASNCPDSIVGPNLLQRCGALRARIKRQRVHGTRMNARGGRIFKSPLLSRGYPAIRHSSQLAEGSTAAAANPWGSGVRVWPGNRVPPALAAALRARRSPLSSLEK